MNIGYVIDLDNIISKESLTIPHLSHLNYKHFESEEFKLSALINFRDEAMRQSSVGQVVDKHIFYIVIKNKLESVQKVASCLASMQEDKINFNQQRYEVHMMLNIIEEGGLSIRQYEDAMPCLRNNAIGIYTWLLDKYDHTGAMPIDATKRAHAIARLACIINNHRRSLSLLQMHSDFSPVYNIFGDSSLFFDDEKRDNTVRYFYYYKTIQHLLNISDNHFETYLKENILPYKDEKAEMDKRLDTSSSVFLQQCRVPLEATFVTEKTQNLLLKSSDTDNEYLVNATDNHLVFIDELARKQKWQMKDTENVVEGYCTRISTGQDHQEIITDEFLKDLQDRVVVHKRTVLDEVNNVISQNRKDHTQKFKDKINQNLQDFLDKRDSQNYTTLSQILTPEDVKAHRSNIDAGIAFLQYLDSGNSEYLKDLEMSAGDTNLLKIRESLSNEEDRLKKRLDEQETEIKDFYSEGEDGTPSVAESRFDKIDKEINNCEKKIRLLTFQLENWYDADTVRKLTARSCATISVVSGILISSLWIFVYYRWIKDLCQFNDLAWTLFTVIFCVGIIYGVCTLWNVIRQRKEFEEKRKRAKEEKKRLMRECMEQMKRVIDTRYHLMLLFHGLKTMTELLTFVRQKEEDLKGFRKLLFRCLVNYKIADMTQAEQFPSDSNTIELRDENARRLLFGPEEGSRTIPFCFCNSESLPLSETFDDYKRKKVRLETLRFAPEFKPQEDFNASAIENEVIPCKENDADKGYQYSALEKESVLPGVSGVEMDDVNQGACGDCYFMATLASIAKMNPEYIIGQKGMIEPLGTDNRFFRVKFYDQIGNRINVDIDNKFWNRSGHPIYAGIGKSNESTEGTYDPWVMAVEKAWAKVNNNGYDGIEGASGDGKESVRMVEYSYAVTGKSAFYCITKNVTDRQKLLGMMKNHVLKEKLPITLYSASGSDKNFSNRDPYMVENHAYALKAVHDDGTFDIFNPWNNCMADEDRRGKHYEKVDIDFIKDNFDVVVFFGIKEADFSSFERELTGNEFDTELFEKFERLMDDSLQEIDIESHNLEELMTDEKLNRLYVDSGYLFNMARLQDRRGVDLNEMNIIYIESTSSCSDAAKNKLQNYIRVRTGATSQRLGDRDDNRQSLTVLRVSPAFIARNFHE